MTEPSGPTPNKDKAAQSAALSSLTSTSVASDPETAATASIESSSTAPDDAAALGAAVSNLTLNEAGPPPNSEGDVKGKGKANAAGESGESGDSALKGKGREKVKEEEQPKKKFKVAAADVSFLAEKLEVSKRRATEMLRRAEGVRNAAIREFVLGGRATGEKKIGEGSGTEGKETAAKA